MRLSVRSYQDTPSSKATAWRNNECSRHHILEFLIEQGIKGATIIESGGMGTYISAIPIFASFLGFMREDRNQSKTILFVVPEDREKRIIAGIESITGNLDKKEGAMIITTEISLMRGTMELM
jgi:PTS system nitrogen regulatory IIA component